MITYRTDIIPDPEAICQLYRAAELNRPVNDVARIGKMYAGSNLVISAWDGDRLVGILRGWTDCAYDGYISDLAVNPDYQKARVGRSLLEHANKLAGPNVQFVLRASKIAADYYQHIGWQRVENGWYMPRSQAG